MLHVEPSSATAIAILVVCLVLVFTFEATNGFHDIANTVVTVIYTNARCPRPAVIWSGLMNFVGVLAGGVAVFYALVELLPSDVLSPAKGYPAVTMLVALFASTCFWNMATWLFGIPTSSSHCITGAPGGVAPATFMCLFLAAPGDKGATWLGSIGLSALISLFSVLVSHFVLRMRMPALKFLGWGLL